MKTGGDGQSSVGGQKIPVMFTLNLSNLGHLKPISLSQALSRNDHKRGFILAIRLDQV